MTTKTFVLLGLLVPHLCSQRLDPPAPSDRRWKERENFRLPRTVERLVHMARTCPPEFAADALIRLSETKIQDRAAKIALLEEAFGLSGAARHPLGFRSLPGSEVDTRSGYRSRAFEAKIDRLSLQCRAVAAMLPVDRRKARELFEQIGSPEVPRMECADSLVPQTDILYRTLASVVLESFTPKERAEERHMDLVSRHIAGIRSGVQIGPMASVVSGLEATPGQRAALVQQFSSVIAAISDDDRTFSYAAPEATRGVGELLQVCKREGLFGLSLLDALRKYLVRHFTAARCAAIGGASERVLIKSFNTTLRSLAGPGGEVIVPLGEEELRPKKSSGAPRRHPYWQTAAAKDFLRRIKELKFGRNTSPLPREQRATAEWIRKAIALLNDLEAWQGDREPSQADYFHEKCVLFLSLVELATDPELTLRVVRSLVSFLTLNRFQIESPVEWFLHFNHLLAIARRNPAILEAVKESKDPVCGLYAELAGNEEADAGASAFARQHRVESLLYFKRAETGQSCTNPRL